MTGYHLAVVKNKQLTIRFLKICFRDCQASVSMAPVLHPSVLALYHGFCSVSIMKVESVFLYLDTEFDHAACFSQ